MSIQTYGIQYFYMIAYTFLVINNHTNHTITMSKTACSTPNLPPSLNGRGMSPLPKRSLRAGTNPSLPLQSAKRINSTTPLLPLRHILVEIGDEY